MPYIAYTRRQLIAELRTAGFEVVRRGKHEIWGAPDGRRFTVPHGGRGDQVSGNVVASWKAMRRAA